jgi:hypothetical protein
MGQDISLRGRKLLGTRNLHSNRAIRRLANRPLDFCTCLAFTDGFHLPISVLLFPKATNLAFYRSPLRLDSCSDQP